MSDQQENSNDHHLKEHEFKPGESGNPAGRPKGAKDGVRAVLRRRLKAAPQGVTEAVLNALKIDTTDKNNADVVVDVLMHKVAEGDLQALKLVFDQTEEPLKKTFGHEGPDGGPIEHKLDLTGLSDEELSILERVTQQPDS